VERGRRAALSSLVEGRREQGAARKAVSHLSDAMLPLLSELWAFEGTSRLQPYRATAVPLR
jgi:hypothetical protein